jgi:hypothetical protein
MVKVKVVGSICGVLVLIGAHATVTALVQADWGHVVGSLWVVALLAD